jgi:WD40 repeat protein
VLAAAAAGWFGLDARNTSNENAALAEQNAAVAVTAQTLQAAEEAQRVEAEAARTDAEQQREEAERQARRALANQLAAQAPSYLDEQMDLAMLLAVQSYNTLDIPQTRGSILEVLDYRPGLLWIMHGHDATLHSVAFGPDSKLLITADVRGTVILWDTETGEIIDYLIYQPFEMGDTFNLNRDVHPMALSPDGHVLALGDYDNPTLLLLDIAAREPIGPPLTAHSAGLRSIAFSPDGAVLATGSRDGTLILWDTETWEPIHSTPFGIFEVGVSALTFSPDGDTLVTAGCLARSADFPTHDCIQAEAMQWDVAALIEHSSDQRPVGHPVACPPGMVTSAAFSPDGRALAFSGCPEVQPNGSCPDPEILLWDMEADQVIGRLLPDLDDPCSDVAFHPEGTLLASACGEFGVIDLWDTATLAHLASTPGSGNLVYSLAFSQDGTMLASSGSTDGLVYLWDVRSLAAPDIARREGGGVSSLLADFPAVVWGLDFNPDGTMLGMSVLNGTIQIWDVETGQRIGEPLIGHTHPWPLSVEFSPDGTILASGSFDQSVRLWDVATGEQIGEPLLGHTEKTSFIVFSLDGAILFTTSHDATIRRWDVATGQPIGEPLTGHTGPITGVDLSPDGTTLATPSSDGTARLWDAMTGEPVGEPFTGHPRGAAGIDFSPDGGILAVGSFGGIILLWDVETHQLIGEPLDAGGWRIWDVSFSPDGQVLAAACEDGMLRLWDVATGLPIGPPLNSQYAATFGVDFSPDGSILATCGKGVGVAGTVRFWDMDPEAWRARACAIAGRNLTQAEWDRYLPDVPYEVTCEQWPTGK